MRPGRETVVVIALTLALIVPSLEDGGFTASSRSWLIVGSGLVLAATVWASPPDILRITGSPVFVALLALGVLSAASAVWTIGEPVDALRYGLTICALAVLMVAAAGVQHWWILAAGLAVFAALEAVIGLWASAQHSYPRAERLDGVWRPGGTFEYPPALALLQVGALPVLARGLGSTRVAVAFAAGFAATLAGAVLGLSGSRIALGLALAVLVAVHLGGATRRSLIGSVMTLLIGAGAGRVLLGSELSRGADAPGLGTVALLLSLAFAAGAGWAVLRSRIGARAPAAALLVAVAGGFAITALADAPSYAPSAGFLHGRTEQWRAAADTFADRPILGFGAGTYAQASTDEQPVSRSAFAHNLQLELAAELGVLALIASIVLFAAVARLLARTRDSDATLLLGPFVAVFLVDNLVDWTWQLSALGAAWAVTLGIVAGQHKEAKQRCR